MEALVQLEHVTKNYDCLRAGGAPAVADVSLAVAAGEAVAIMGPVGQREVHAAQPDRRAGPADERNGPGRR